MPITNAGLGSFSVGRDCTLVLIGGSFGRVDLPNVTGFESKQVTMPVHVDRLDGTQIHAELPKGWEGHFELERGSAAVDDFFAAIESAWYDQNGSYSVGNVYQYVQEPNGSQSTYQYDNCSFTLTDAGSWKGDASVKQRIQFRANRRRRV